MELFEVLTLLKREMGRLAVALLVSLWVFPISIVLNQIVPDPYMDEIFHIPQVQQYCKGNFSSWDPMITTPPGLYYLSLVHVAYMFPGTSFLQAASSFSDVCSTAILRSVNGVLAVICSILVYEIVTHLRPTLDGGKATLYAVVLALYPLHWFFSFLYYTDVASLTVVLAMYLTCLKKNYQYSALLGALAVVIRQTNIIWMLFVACTGIIDVTLPHGRDNRKVDDCDASIQKNSQSSLDKSVPAGSNLRKRKSGVSGAAGMVYNPNISDSSKTCPGLLDEIRALLLSSWNLKWELLISFSPFFLVLVAFIAFVLWNGSVVLGAKEAHAVSLHFAQLFYFSLVSALATAPMHFTFSQSWSLFWSFWKNRPFSYFQVLISLLAGFLSVHFFSIVHPYLLADNRHYPFYLWRKVIKAHWLMKYLLVPFYVYSWLSIFNILGKVKRKIWVLVYFLACGAVLVPAPLIEFRYYTIPFYFLVLHSHINDTRSWLLMGIIYIVVNALTMMMFLYRPFHWDHEPGMQRFIW